MTIVPPTGPTMTKTRRPTLKRFRPDPKGYEERYGPFSMTDRRLAILQLIHRYRYIESRHVKALIPGSDQNIARDLGALVHTKRVHRVRAYKGMRTKRYWGRAVEGFVLDRQGWLDIEPLERQRAENEGRDFDTARWRKEYTRRGEPFLEHNLGVSDFHCTLELALRDHQEAELWEWDQGRAIWADVKDSDIGNYTLKPDGYFAIAGAGGLRHCFLEYDRSSEERSRIEEKYRKYWYYFQTPEYAEDHDNHRAVNVLFVSTGAARLEGLQTVLRKMEKPNRAKEHGGKGMFWFALAAEYNLRNPKSLLEPIWRSTTRNERQRLV